MNFVDDTITLVEKGYMVLGQETKEVPPAGCTGRHEWKNGFFVDAEYDTNYLAVRFSEDTIGLDIDTDITAKHKTNGMERLAEVWKDFNATFDFMPVVTGANRNNYAGIYHFRLEEGLTEWDVARIRIDNLDVLRKSHRFAVVRGTHPKTGNQYEGNLPAIDQLPVFTKEMLDWFLERNDGPTDFVSNTQVEAVDMPELHPITDAERAVMHDKALDSVDWSATGGRNKRLFAATVRAYYKAIGERPEERMGKALAYIQPYVEEALDGSGGDRQKMRQYGSIERFWIGNKGLSEVLLEGKDDSDSVEAIPVTESENIEGLDLMNRVVKHYDKYIVTQHDDHTVLISLWTIHTYVVDETYTTPRLIIDSAVPGSGKTTVLDHMRRLCLQPLGLASISSDALLARVVQNGPRTLLIDEVDRTLSPKNPKAEDVIAILNSGYRKGSTRPVLEPDTNGGWTVAEMPTFAPVVMAGNNPFLPEDTVQRSIKVLLMPDTLGEAEDSDWQTIEDEVKALGEEIGRWCNRVRDQIRTNKPKMPEGIRGRMREKWEPLKRVAEAIGGDYPTMVDNMALRELEQMKQDMEDGLTYLPAPIILLKDLYAVWNEGEEFIKTEELVQRLTYENPDQWGAESTYGKPLNVQRMGKMLNGTFQIRSDRPRIDGKQARGYHRRDFQKAWRQFADQIKKEED